MERGPLADVDWTDVQAVEAARREIAMQPAGSYVLRREAAMRMLGSVVDLLWEREPAPGHQRTAGPGAGD